MVTRSRNTATNRLVIALDGPASSGKSSVGAAAAAQLGMRFVDTGLFYRALTALALREDVPLDDASALVPLVSRVTLGDGGDGRLTRVLLDGDDATDEARGPLVDASVSAVARVPEVREALLERQRALAADGGIVVAGRDIGTVVLPDADLKLFLDASVEERAARRIGERGLDPQGGEADNVRAQLRERDILDSTREVAPLRAADDAVHVRTDGNEFTETVEIVTAEIARLMLNPPKKPARTRTRQPKAVAVPDAPALDSAGPAAAPTDEASVSGAGTSSPGDAHGVDEAPQTGAAMPGEAPLDAADASETGDPPPRAAGPVEPTQPTVVPAPGPARSARIGRAAAAIARPRRASNLETALRLDNHQSTLIRMVALVSRIGARLFADVVVEGLDNVPRTGAVILAANHISNADPVVLGSWLTPALKRRRIHWLGKKELFSWPVFGLMAAHGGIHPVDRDAADVEAFRLASRILDSGYVLLVFPEGTRSPNGELQEPKDGAAMLALRTGAAIVPIGVSNSDAVWRKGQTLPSPLPRRTVTVRIGRPFTVAGVLPPGTDRRAAKRIATREIMRRIASLVDTRHRGAYADAIQESASPEG